MLIGADILAVLALPTAAFGTFALLQGLILSGAVISAWGTDQSVISIVGRSDSTRYDIHSYLTAIRLRVALRSLIVAALFAGIALGSRVSIAPETLVIAAIITTLEAQLILNAAVLRATFRPYLAVLFLDGLRHLGLLAAAVLVFASGGGFETLIVYWLVAAIVSFVAGSVMVLRGQRGRGSEMLPEAFQAHAAVISKFSGMWSVMQFVFSRMVLVFSAYMLSPDDLGIVAFFLKLMVVFTFLQTVMVQAVAPIIGRVSTAENREQASRVYSVTTFFLAVTVPPLIGVSLLEMDLIKSTFSISYSGPAFALTALFLAQALNIGTGIIGQFIIHFGYARELLTVSVVGVIVQIVLLLGLGVKFGIPGIFFAYASASVLLVGLKNILAAQKIGFHGFKQSNLIIIGAIAVEVLAFGAYADQVSIGLIWTLLLHTAFCLLISCVALTRVPEAMRWVKTKIL